MRNCSRKSKRCEEMRSRLIFYLHLRLSQSWQFKATEGLFLCHLTSSHLSFSVHLKEHLRMIGSPTPPSEGLSLLPRLFSAKPEQRLRLFLSSICHFQSIAQSVSTSLNLLSLQFSCIPNVLLKHHTTCRTQ